MFVKQQGHVYSFLLLFDVAAGAGLDAEIAMVRLCIRRMREIHSRRMCIAPTLIHRACTCGAFPEGSLAVAMLRYYEDMIRVNNFHGAIINQLGGYLPPPMPWMLPPLSSAASFGAAAVVPPGAAGVGVGPAAFFANSPAPQFPVGDRAVMVERLERERERAERGSAHMRHPSAGQNRSREGGVPPGHALADEQRTGKCLLGLKSQHAASGSERSLCPSFINLSLAMQRRCLLAVASPRSLCSRVLHSLWFRRQTVPQGPYSHATHDGPCARSHVSAARGPVAFAVAVCWRCASPCGGGAEDASA